MIKKLPGWLNYILLWAVYFGFGVALKAITGFKCDVRFIALFTAFYCGAYLSKYRFNSKGEEKWRFW